jgi:hypothetical protein
MVVVQILAREADCPDCATLTAQGEHLEMYGQTGNTIA